MWCECTSLRADDGERDLLQSKAGLAHLLLLARLAFDRITDISFFVANSPLTLNVKLRAVAGQSGGVADDALVKTGVGSAQIGEGQNAGESI